MNKFVVLQAIIITVGAMLVAIPSVSTTQVAKASTCSASVGFPGGVTVSASSTTSGSCSTGGAIGDHQGVLGPHGGSKSSCSSGSASQSSSSISLQDSNGAVSCSSHSPWLFFLGHSTEPWILCTFNYLFGFEHSPSDETYRLLSWFLSLYCCYFSIYEILEKHLLLTGE